jgi:CheY-like chemotaxis protein
MEIINKPKQIMAFSILLVDDAKQESHFLKNVLVELSTKANLESVDGIELIDYLSNKVSALPDILFLDLNMPGKNGFECLEDLKLHKVFQHIPVIMYSASFDE